MLRPITTASMLLFGLFGLLWVGGCGSSEAGPEQPSSYSSCADLLADPHFEGEGRPMGALDGAGSPQCLVVFPGQGAALAFLGISTGCPKEGAVFVSFDLQEDGETWFLDREASALANQDACGFSQKQTPVVITKR